MQAGWGWSLAEQPSLEWEKEPVTTPHPGCVTRRADFSGVKMRGHGGRVRSRWFGPQDENGTGKMAEQQEGRSLVLRMFKERRTSLLCLGVPFPSGLPHLSTSDVFINLA